MLGKTANGLFWMYRYLERAENTSRLVETGERISLTRLGTGGNDWESVLQTAGALDSFLAHHDGPPDREAAIDWLLRAADNPSSVRSCIATARQNARLVRTALTLEIWEATNAAYMQAREELARKVAERDLPRVLHDIRRSAALVRGETGGTKLRNDKYNFARIGTFVERADNTARILDVKYYVLLPSVSAVGSSLDNVQWETILRSLSAQGGYRIEYGNRVNPRDIADFLILDRRLPRSLGYCLGKLRTNIGWLVRTYGQETRSWEMVQALDEENRAQSIDEIFDSGLHEYLQDMLARIATLGRQIEIDYRFYE